MKYSLNIILNFSETNIINNIKCVHVILHPSYLVKFIK